MIPYDDLVAALTSWRARQGLPVAASLPVPTSGAAVAPGSGPVRATPPAPPRGGYQPPPLASPDDGGTLDVAPEGGYDDVDDAALLEEAHDEQDPGGDYAMRFAPPAVERDEESTMLGHAPEPGGETNFDPKSRKPW